MFFFIFIDLSGGSVKSLLQFMSERVLSLFSYKSFVVSVLIFMYAIYFEFIFVFVLRSVLILFFYK